VTVSWKKISNRLRSLTRIPFMNCYFASRRATLSLELETDFSLAMIEYKRMNSIRYSTYLWKKTVKRRRMCKEVYFCLLTVRWIRRDGSTYSILIYYFNEDKKRWTKRDRKENKQLLIIPQWIASVREVTENKWWW